MSPSRSKGVRPTGINHPNFRRRDFMRLLGISGAGVAATSALGACSTQGTADQDFAEVTDASATEKVVNFSNWPLYIDTEDGAHPTLEAFEKSSGISVNYVEEINDNAPFFAKIRPQLSSGQATGSDLIVLTNDWAARMVELDWVQEIDLDNVPNAKNLLENLASPPFDPERKYSLPWQSGFTAIGTNVEAAGREITTIEELLTARDLRGRVTVLSEMSDTMSLIMLELEIDPSDFSQSEFDKAIKKLETALEIGQIRQVTGNEYAPQLAKGDIAAAMAWSGDVIQLQFEEAEVTFTVPEKGGFLWSDNMLIPVLAEHKENAEKLMDFYYDPVIAAEVAAWVNYICPVDGAQEAMKDIDPELVDNELIFPSEDMLSNVHEFKFMPWDEREPLEDQFTRAVGL